MRRFGGLLSIELADADAVHALVRRSDLPVAATSFGGMHLSRPPGPAMAMPSPTDGFCLHLGRYRGHR